MPRYKYLLYRSFRQHGLSRYEAYARATFYFNYYFDLFYQEDKEKANLWRLGFNS